MQFQNTMASSVLNLHYDLTFQNEVKTWTHGNIYMRSRWKSWRTSNRCCYPSIDLKELLISLFQVKGAPSVQMQSIPIDFFDRDDVFNQLEVIKRFSSHKMIGNFDSSPISILKLRHLLRNSTEKCSTLAKWRNF